MTFHLAPRMRFPANYRRCSACLGWKTNKGMKLKPRCVCAECLAKKVDPTNDEGPEGPCVLTRG